MAVSISSADDFYERLAALSDFGRVGDDTAFSPVPDDWCLLAADIVRSRDALAEGRYKTVNMIAAAVVTAPPPADTADTSAPPSLPSFLLGTGGN